MLTFPKKTTIIATTLVRSILTLTTFLPKTVLTDVQKSKLLTTFPQTSILPMTKVTTVLSSMKQTTTSKNAQESKILTTFPKKTILPMTQVTTVLSSMKQTTISYNAQDSKITTTFPKKNISPMNQITAVSSSIQHTTTSKNTQESKILTTFPQKTISPMAQVTTVLSSMKQTTTSYNAQESKILTTFPQKTISPMTQVTTVSSSMKQTTILTPLSTVEETRFNVLPEKTVLDNIQEIYRRIYLLGFDNFNNVMTGEKCKFYTYFILQEIPIPKTIGMFFELEYRKLRHLQNNDYNFEEVKGMCNFISIDESEQLKYGCEFDKNGKDLTNIKVLEKYEFDGKPVNLTGISAIAETCARNLKNCEGLIFDRILFILNNSYIINNNEYDFTIIGNLMKNEKLFHHKELLLIISFLSENKTEKEMKNINCTLFELNENECKLKCMPDEYLKGEIIKGFSFLNDSNLVIIFNENKSKIGVNPSISYENRFYYKRNKGLPTGGIVAIILASACCLFILLFVFIYTLKRINRKANQNEGTENRKTYQKEGIEIDSTFKSIIRNPF